MIYDCDVSVMWIGWLSVLKSTIHGETYLIRYAAKFSVEVYEIMIVYVMKIYNMNMNFLYARMFEGKCTKLHMDIVWWHNHDSIYESLHICMQMKKIHDYTRLDPFTWRQLFGSLLMKVVKKKCRSLT